MDSHCRKRWNPGGESRNMISPNVTTFMDLLFLWFEPGVYGFADTDAEPAYFALPAAMLA